MRALVLLLPLGLLVSACATPRESCIAQATRDQVVVNHLVAQLETDLARGYGMKTVQVVTPVWRPCRWNHRPGAPVMCWYDDVSTEQKPVAIDLTATKARLVELKAKQAELARTTPTRVAACQAQFPQ